jgi:hypothetical protein
MAGTAGVISPIAHERDVRDTALSAGITVDALRETFPRWRLFPAAAVWWAARGGTVMWDGPESLLRRVITAQDLPALAERLCLQEHLDGLDPEALTAVYRNMNLRETAQ